MSYRLEFHQLALKEWRALDRSVQIQFKKKLVKVLEAPHIPANRLRGAKPRYKIKLRKSGFRLVYEVIDERVVVVAIAIGKRDKLAVYGLADRRSSI